MNESTTKSLLQAASGKRGARIPVWFLRQAGRYLPEYREIRAKNSFLEVCRNPDLAKEITLQPLKRFDLDAAIIFSDILIPCTAVGQTLTFDSGHGPVLTQPVRSAQDLAALQKPNAEKVLGFVGEAIAKTKAALQPHQTMIGFAGAPFTVASYMIEGRGTKDFTEIKKLMYREPKVFSGLLDFLVDVTADYLKMQIRAGADCVMLFDTWVGNISALDYRETILPRMKLLFGMLKESRVPVIYYPGQGLDKLLELYGVDVNVVAIDWRTSLTHASKALSHNHMHCALQGNIDPQIFLGTEATVRERTKSILTESRATGRPHIFNVGHGLLPHTPIEAISWCVDEVRKFENLK